MKTFAVALLLLAALPCAAQSIPVVQDQTMPTQEPIPPLPPEPLPATPPGARVVASPEMTKHNDGLAAPAPQATAKATAQPDRDLLTVTAWDLELLLRPATHGLAARAHVTVRNDDAKPRATVALQVSSSLRWESVTQAGKPLALTAQSLDTGFDHSGASSEAVITLSQSLAPGASTTLDCFYEGSIVVDATRIQMLGAPPDIAQHTDWDRIDGDFTGLRGAGNVLWFPIAAEPVQLGDGARLFSALGQWKLRHAASTMRVRLRVDTSADVDLEQHAVLSRSGPGVVVRAAPQTAIVNGVRLKLAAEQENLLTAELPAMPLGFSGGSLFLANAETVSAPGLHVYAAPGEANNAPAYPTAINLVRPLVEQWLPRQQRDIAVLSLPRDGDAPSTTEAWWQAADGGPVLATPMPPQLPEQVAPAMADVLTRGSFLSPRPWLAEGVPYFLSALWAGHDENAHALEMLEGSRPALALAEPADATSGAQPLIAAYDDIFYRVKSAYVLWMLRDICGDEALVAALKAYKPAQDTSREYFERLIETSSHKDLAWFFADWVYADHGLPDLHIAKATVSHTETAGGSWLVNAEISNDGYAAADVPVRVDAAGQQESQRLRVPARGSATARIVIHKQPTQLTVGNGSVPEVEAGVHARDL